MSGERCVGMFEPCYAPATRLFTDHPMCEEHYAAAERLAAYLDENPEKLELLAELLEIAEAGGVQ